MKFSQIYILNVFKKKKIFLKKPFGLGGLNKNSLHIEERMFSDCDKKEYILAADDFSLEISGLDVIVDVIVLLFMIKILKRKNYYK